MSLQCDKLSNVASDTKLFHGIIPLLKNGVSFHNNLKELPIIFRYGIHIMNRGNTPSKSIAGIPEEL